jgi:two-component system, chemotaxis family, chemotaxis protein CheY
MNKILIVDDSSTSRMFIKKCLEMVLPEKPTFFDAENGEKALNVMAENKIDLVVSDVNMPVMTGFTFLRNLKDNPLITNVPVIFTTSLANDARVQNLMELGARCVLKKPVSPASLGEAIKKIIIESQGSSSASGKDSSWG